MPAHHLLDEYLTEYVVAAGIESDTKGYLFRTCRGRSDELTENPLTHAAAYRMIRRRALAAGIRTRIGNHTFRATGINEYLRTAAS